MKMIFQIRECFNFICGMKIFICEINFHLWIFHCLRKLHVSYTNSVKFWTKSLPMRIRYFICLRVPLSLVKWRFHMWKGSKFHMFSNLKWHEHEPRVGLRGLWPPLNVNWGGDWSPIWYQYIEPIEQLSYSLVFWISVTFFSTTKVFLVQHRTNTVCHLPSDPTWCCSISTDFIIKKL